MGRHAYAELTSIKPFEIDWLGGYWKLPAKPSVDGHGGTMNDIHKRIVSSFSSAEKRTAEVPQEHLDEIYSALTPALPRIFSSGSLGVQMIMNVYKDEVNFRAFALSRAAAAMRATDMPKAMGLLELARQSVKEIDVDSDEAFHADLPERSVLSYIDRNRGVCWSMQNDWDKALLDFQASLRKLPLNSTAYYLKGCACQEQQRYDDAIMCMRRSIAADPDFKSPYVALGSCYLLSGQFQAAIDASASCLNRHPDAPGAQFNIGQAIYHMMCEGGVDKQDAAVMCEKAKEALDLAKRRMPEQWSDADEKMVEYLSADSKERAGHERQPAHSWKVYGWRP